jgi:hypothetical protein
VERNSAQTPLSGNSYFYWVFESAEKKYVDDVEELKFGIALQHRSFSASGEGDGG